MMGYDNQEQSDSIIPFPLLTKSAVESLRYRAEVILYRICINSVNSYELHNTINLSLIQMSCFLVILFGTGTVRFCWYSVP